MPFLGTTPTQGFVGANPKQSFTADGSTTVFTLTNPVASANDLEVFVGNVRQEPTAAYSAAGTTLTMTEAPDTGLNFYVINKSQAQVTTTPPVNSISTDKIVANAVTGAKLASTISTNHTFSGTLAVPAATSGWRHIKTQTGTNASSIDFLHGSNGVVFDDTYEVYEFIIHYAYGASNDELRIEPSQDGSSFSNTNTIGHATGAYRASGSSSSYNVDTGANGFFRSLVNCGNAENEISGGQIRIYSPFDSAKNTVACTTFSTYQQSGTYSSQINIGAMTAAGRTHGIRFKIASGNIYAKISLYGIKDS